MSKLVNICLIGTGRAGMIHGKTSLAELKMQN